jgi:hypothetical protein
MPKKPKKTINDLINKLGIDEKLTKVRKQPKVFNRVKDNVPLKQDYNFMADLLFLPKSDRGFKYCLVVVDLSNDEFDIEEIRNKESDTVLKAMKNIFKRGILKKPYASIRTDSGSEFKGVFHKYLYDESIMHKVALPNRHSQLANVEALNKQLGRLFNGYMNMKELETGEVFRNWTKIIPIVRRDLNSIRKKTLPKDEATHTYPIFDPTVKIKKKVKRLLPAYKVGDKVHRLMDYPKNALGEKQTGSFRQGDFRYEVDPREIIDVYYYSGRIPYRYKLKGIPNASYSESQLIKA